MKNSEAPAFPLVLKHEKHEIFDGLTKREYFASMAMQGMLANSIATEFLRKHGEVTVNECIAKESVKIADLLIAALNK